MCSAVSLLQTLRTFHKVEVAITSEQHEHFQAKDVFQVANAPSAMAAMRAVEQYVTSSWEWAAEFGEPAKGITLISVNPLSMPDPGLFASRTLICNPQPTADGSQRRISFVQCEREQSLHLAYDTACVYVSDGLKVYEFGADNDYARQLIVDGSMVYVRTEITFALPPPSVPVMHPPAIQPPPSFD